MRNTLVTEILGRKGSAVFTIRPDSTIHDAVMMLVDKGVGSLVVTDGNDVVGIITERDILNENARRFKHIDETRVREVMTGEVVFGRPDQSVDEVMRLMSERRIRHLPILQQGKLIGMVSIGDLVVTQLGVVTDENEHLHNFITGQYPG